MKLGKQKLAVALGAALGLGIAGQASADVYGLSYVQVDNLNIVINASGGSAGLFSFASNNSASLDGSATASNATCGGNFPSQGSCTGVNPVLSATAQNALGSVDVRLENDYTKFGTGAQYSGSESAIVTAVLAGDATTSTKSISESNLTSGTIADASTNVSSNTTLTLQFAVQGDGSFQISFDAVIDVLSQVTGGDIGQALASSGLTVVLNKQGFGTVASWAPTGTATVSICGVGFTCAASETALSLNNSTSSAGTPDQVAGSGSYGLRVTGLTDGIYTLGLTNTTSTLLFRDTPIPVPGTLLLLGTGLLMAGRATRRGKQ